MMLLLAIALCLIITSLGANCPDGAQIYGKYKCLVGTAFTLCLIVTSFGANYPNGAQIYDSGISEAGKTEVVERINQYRLMVAKGQVPQQPRGINLKRMEYDEALGETAQVVSNTCKTKLLPVVDQRWPNVGQTLYWERSSTYNPANQNWTAAVRRWYNQYVDYQYPKSYFNAYTQIVWADTKLIGCDYIWFYDTKYPQYPYTKMYTCNYGPMGNLQNEAPYKTGLSGCENLC